MTTQDFLKKIVFSELGNYGVIAFTYWGHQTLSWELGKDNYVPSISLKKQNISLRIEIEIANNKEILMKTDKN